MIPEIEPNKTDECDGYYGIFRVSNVLISPSPDPKRPTSSIP